MIIPILIKLLEIRIVANKCRGFDNKSRITLSMGNDEAAN